MCVQALNITLMSAGYGFLRLNHFQIVGNTGGKTILRLVERLVRQIDGTAGNFDLLGSRIQIQQGGANFIVDAAAQIISIENVPASTGHRLRERRCELFHPQKWGY